MKSRKIYIILLTVFLLIAVVSGGVCVYLIRDAGASAESFDDLEELIAIPTESAAQFVPPESIADSIDSPDDPGSPEETVAPDSIEASIAYEKYKALYEQNEDFVGWISIADTSISYPVMQSVDNPGFYLKHSFDKTYSNYGVPYLDEACTAGVSNNLIIYGHNMNNGTMFHDLLKYSDASYWEAHQFIQFDTLSHLGEYQIVLVFRFDANHEDFRYNKYTDMDEAAFIDFMDQCRSRQLYVTGVSVEYGDEMLTLSTCEYSQDNGRFIVLAKKID